MEKPDHPLIQDKKQAEKQIGELKARISYIRELLSSGQIEPEDFRVIGIRIALLEDLVGTSNLFVNDSLFYGRTKPDEMLKRIRVKCTPKVGKTFGAHFTVERAITYI